MCLWFACFGLHKHNDDSYAPPPAGGVPAKPPHDGRPPQGARYGNGNGYGHGHYGAGAPHTAAGAGADEAGRKASNDARRGPAAPAAKYAPEKAAVYTGAAETVRQPAWNRKDAAMDCRHYTASATTDHGRY